MVTWIRTRNKESKNYLPEKELTAIFAIWGF